MSGLRLAIAGCGRAARIHAARLVALRDDVEIVACADVDRRVAEELSELIRGTRPESSISIHEGLAEALRETPIDAVAIFAPHRFHYRLAMEALQFGCHVFIEKPLSTNPQEAVDIVNLARARGLTVAVGHQYRLAPSLMEARARLLAGEIGDVHLVVGTFAAPWLAMHEGPRDAWRLDPKISGGGMLADSGDHLIDSMLWTTGRAATEAVAFQVKRPTGIDVVTAAALMLGDGVTALIGLTALAGSTRFEIEYHGSSGRLLATDRSLVHVSADGASQAVALASDSRSIDADFVESIRMGTSPSCPASEALGTVRLLDAIARSSATGQVVRLS